MARRGIVFLCVHNAARSQMAEGLARAMAAADVLVFSAGSDPSTVHPLAISAMDEVGIDIRGQFSKPLHAVDWGSVGTAVTLCQEAVCPMVPAEAQKLHWPLLDPAVHGAGAGLAAFRACRDELQHRVRELLSEFEPQDEVERRRVLAQQLLKAEARFLRARATYANRKTPETRAEMELARTALDHLNGMVQGAS